MYVILITATNGPLVYVLLTQATKTFIDWLIITDYILCIPNIDCRDDADVCLEVRDAGECAGLLHDVRQHLPHLLQQTPHPWHRHLQICVCSPQFSGGN